ncbi:MAG: BrnA antitoxin family protein [Zoogloeaceae bacterium]|jgi:predicted DNA binding CopG/RHH family protein|nr:BrnA antitoxin family protein [Zoogloeaceae bacterium]
MPSDEENAEIHAAALSDPDAQPWTDEELEAVQPHITFGRGGTTRITIRVDSRTLAAFRARAERSGDNYQTLMNRALNAFLEGETLSEVVRKTIREELRA